MIHVIGINYKEWIHITWKFLGIGIIRYPCLIIFLIFPFCTLFITLYHLLCFTIFLFSFYLFIMFHFFRYLTPPRQQRLSSLGEKVYLDSLEINRFSNEKILVCSMTRLSRSSRSKLLMLLEHLKGSWPSLYPEAGMSYPSWSRNSWWRGVNTK